MAGGVTWGLADGVAVLGRECLWVELIWWSMERYSVGDGNGLVVFGEGGGLWG